MHFNYVDHTSGMHVKASSIAVYGRQTDTLWIV
jgi:hypothetical protein